MSPLPLTAPASAAGPPALGTASGVDAPASIRNGSSAVKQAYAAAQGFEEMLLQQLSQSLTQSSGLSGESEAGGGESSGGEGSLTAGAGAEGGMLASLLPQTLTEGIMRAGGLGLAAQLTRTLDPATSAAASAGSAGVSAASSSASVGSAGGASAPAGTSSAVVPAAATNGAAVPRGGGGSA